VEGTTMNAKSRLTTIIWKTIRLNLGRRVPLGVSLARPEPKYGMRVFQPSDSSRGKFVGKHMTTIITETSAKTLSDCAALTRAQRISRARC
jgi:hypothetical protein